MSVWYVIPSKRPVAEANRCLEAWEDMGYNVAIMREYSDEAINLDLLSVGTDRYQGWARSVNILVHRVMAHDSRAEWFVTGGDDYFPDPAKRAEEVAAECWHYFADLPLCGSVLQRAVDARATALFGVMQPTGDRWGESNGVATIDRICGSPWMGREFCRRMYSGGGPLYNGYFHNFADEELQNVALKLGVLWQRRDLTQEHRHWARPRGDWRDAPPWARAINDPQLSDWERSKALFAKRKAAGFPGHEPLEV